MTTTEEVESLNSDIGSVIFKSTAPPILVGGEGNILPCIELCNINFNFQTQNKFTVTNQNGKLYVLPDAGLSSKSTMFPCYSSIDICSESNTPSNMLYTLVDIVITCPSLHRMYVNGSSTIFDGEIYIVFKNSTNGNDTYKVLAVLFEQTTDLSTAVSNDSLTAYKLFESLGADLPERNAMKTISTIADWDLNDLLPKNKWFYNYTHPNNLSVNWYVYKHKIYVPNSFKTNYISAVSQIVKNGTISTGTQAYNTLHSTISTIQNPVTSDNSFVIFEQRDLSSSSGSSGSSSSSTSSNVNNANSIESCKALLSESQGLETSGEEQLFTSQKQSTTSTTSEKKTTSENNYSTGSKDSFFGEEEESSDITSNIEEQITEENKTWSVIVMVLNVLFFCGIVTLIVLCFVKKNKLTNMLANIVKGTSYNIIFYLVSILLFNLIYSSIYLSMGIKSSALAKGNIGLISINWIIFIALIIIIVVIYVKYTKSLGFESQGINFTPAGLEMIETNGEKIRNKGKLTPKNFEEATELEHRTSVKNGGKKGRKKRIKKL
jgi:carbonic anhydrase